MLELGRDPGLAQQLAAVAGGGVGDLHRHHPAQLAVVDAQDLAGRADPERLADLVARLGRIAVERQAGAVGTEALLGRPGPEHRPHPFPAGGVGEAGKEYTGPGPAPRPQPAAVGGCARRPAAGPGPAGNRQRTLCGPLSTNPVGAHLQRTMISLATARGTMPTPATDPADESLLRRAATGDHAAFAELARRHHALLLRIARAVVREPSLADDAVQEALIAAFRNAATWTGHGEARAWLAVIALNAARSSARAQAARGRLVAAATRPVIAVAEPEIDAEALWSRVADLPPEQQEVVILHFRGGSLPRIAAELGLTRFGVHKRLRRALASLRRSMRVRARTLAVALMLPLLGEAAQLAASPRAAARWIAVAVAVVAAVVAVGVVRLARADAADPADAAAAMPGDRSATVKDLGAAIGVAPSAGGGAAADAAVPAPPLVDLLPAECDAVVDLRVPPSGLGSLEVAVPWLPPALLAATAHAVVGFDEAGPGDPSWWILLEGDRPAPWPVIVDQIRARAAATGWECGAETASPRPMLRVRGSSEMRVEIVPPVLGRPPVVKTVFRTDATAGAMPATWIACVELAPG